MPENNGDGNSKMQRGGGGNVSTPAGQLEGGRMTTVNLTPVQEGSAVPPEVPEGGARIRVHYAGTILTPKTNVPTTQRPRANSGQSAQEMQAAYEVSGVIDKICNKSDSSLQKGDNVIVYPDEATTQLTHDGGFPTYILVNDVSNIVRVPGELSLEVAALLPGGALLAYAAVKRVRLLLQHKLTTANADNPCNILIVGASGQGLWALKAAQYLVGSADNIHITMADVSIDNLMVCKNHGCFDVVHWNDSIHEEYIQERTKDVCKGGVDVAIDFVSSPRSINRLTKVLKQEGVIVVGGRSKYDINICLNTLSEKNQSVIGVKGGSKHDLEELVEILATRKVSPPPFTVFPLDQANKALDQLKQYQISPSTLLQVMPLPKQ